MPRNWKKVIRTIIDGPTYPSDRGTNCGVPVLGTALYNDILGLLVRSWVLLGICDGRKSVEKLNDNNVIMLEERIVFHSLLHAVRKSPTTLKKN